MEDEIRRMEFHLMAEKSLEGKSTEYRLGYLKGVTDLIDYETERIKVLKEASVGKGKTLGR